LGVLISKDLKPSKQCVAAANKARLVLGMIYRNFKVINKRQFLTLYKTYVRPHLEYCIQAWSPSLRKDIDCLENVQRRATKMVAGEEFELCAAPRKTEFDNSGRKEETRGHNQNVQIVNWKGKCGLSAILQEVGQSAQAVRS